MSDVLGPVRLQTFEDTTVKLFQPDDSKISSAAKLFIYPIDWLKYFGFVNADSPTANNIRSTANIVKLVTGGTFEIPGKLREIRAAMLVFYHHRTSENGKKVLWALNGLVNPVADTVELAAERGIGNVSADTVASIKKLNGVSMFFHWGRVAMGSWNGYWQEKGVRPLSSQQDADHQRELNKQIYECAKAVSYFAVSILIISSLFLGIVAPPIAFTTALTSALVFTLLGFYNAELGRTAKSIRPTLLAPAFPPPLNGGG
ncbi:MAG TPA: hypothetical protein VLG76_00150 [Rhabdochlamydiaceae bacterium]|nr:hypothetical protein [Rhabdochlamydiaceae bacterium]